MKKVLLYILKMNNALLSDKTKKKHLFNKYLES